MQEDLESARLLLMAPPVSSWLSAPVSQITHESPGTWSHKALSR